MAGSRPPEVDGRGPAKKQAYRQVAVSGHSMALPTLTADSLFPRLECTRRFRAVRYRMSLSVASPMFHTFQEKCHDHT